MSWPSALVLVRHAESEGNVLTSQQRAQYALSTDKYPLTERGREQAHITGGYLQRQFGEFDVHYVSYYERSRETMRIMCPDARVYEDPRLAEATRGIWHTMTYEEIERHCPWEITRRNREGYYHYRPPGGENWPDVEMRIHSFLGTLSRDYGGKKVLIVVHGHWLILFQRLVDRFSIEEAVERYNRGTANNASITVYRGTDGLDRLVCDEENITPWEELV